ncbi:MAG: SpoIIE family protein phosphatase [Magnetococcales bacterium]|nr:SpoIIE family protein phosphatase [Magnetococcales bacterium]
MNQIALQVYRFLKVLLVFFVGAIILVVILWMTTQHLQEEIDAESLEQTEAFRTKTQGTLQFLTVPLRVLETVPEIVSLLSQPSSEGARIVDQMLEKAAKILFVDAIFLMDAQGVTLSASNWRTPESFVGKNYAFRPYFQQAMTGNVGTYVAQGVTSKTVGIYIARPVSNQDNTQLGVVVIKYPADVLLPRQGQQIQSPRYFIADEMGIIFSSNYKELFLGSTGELDSPTRSCIESTRKYDLSLVGKPSGIVELLADHAPLDEYVSGSRIRWQTAGKNSWYSFLPPTGFHGRILDLPHPAGWKVGVLLPNNNEFTTEHLIARGLAGLLAYMVLLLLLFFFIQRRRHHAYVSLLVRHVPAAMALFDRDMKYLHASQRWLDNHKLATHSVTGKSHFALCPDLPARWRDIADNCLNGVWERKDAELFENRDGSSDWYTWEALPWRDRHGRIGGILMFSERITERIRMEKQVAWQRDKLAYERGFIEEIIVRMRASQRFDPHRMRFVMAPVEKTAGDLLLSARPADGSQYVMLGDFTGHGLTAALGGPLVSDIFYSMTAKGLPLADIVREINRQLKLKMPTGLFMAACFAELNPGRDLLTVWNFSMPELLLFAEGAIVARFPSDDLPMGVIAELDGESVSHAFHPGNRLIAFSDGVVEVADPEGNFLGQEAVESVLLQILIADQNLELLKNVLEAYRDQPDQADDITIVELNH